MLHYPARLNYFCKTFASPLITAHTTMSSGFEVRSVSVDRNVMKRLRKEEDEEIFTLQVGGNLVGKYLLLHSSHFVYEMRKLMNVQQGQAF